MVDIVVGQVTVPDVEDTDQGAAEAAITAVYLAVAYATSEYSDTVAVGKIISQSPAAGSSVDPGSTVTLTVSLGERPGVSAASGSQAIPGRVRFFMFQRRKRSRPSIPLRR